MGRKKKPIEQHWQTVAARVPPSTANEILQLKQRDNLTKSKVVRKLIEVGLEIERQVAARTRAA